MLIYQENDSLQNLDNNVEPPAGASKAITVEAAAAYLNRYAERLKLIRAYKTINPSVDYKMEPDREPIGIILPKKPIFELLTPVDCDSLGVLFGLDESNQLTILVVGTKYDGSPLPNQSIVFEDMGQCCKLCSTVETVETKAACAISTYFPSIASKSAKSTAGKVLPAASINGKAIPESNGVH